MDELREKHRTAVEKSQEARQEAGRQQTALDHAEAELAGINNKIRERILSQARLGRAADVQDLIVRRLELQEIVKTLPEALRAAQAEVRSRHTIVEGLGNALTGRRMEAERAARQKKIMALLETGMLEDAVARELGLTPAEYEDAKPRNVIGGVGAFRKGENSNDVRQPDVRV